MTRKQHRLGFIVPAINVIAEDDFIALAARDVGVHFARADVDTTRDIADQFGQMIDAAPELAASLAKAGVAVIAFACTSASFFRGEGSDRAIADAMTAQAHVPTLTTATAAIAALHAIGAKKIVIATPYLTWVYEAERTFFAGAGFEVLAVNGLERRGGADINTISDDEIRALVADINCADADAIFVSCTDLPVLELIDELEDTHGKPVITSNQATFWACAKAASLDPVPGYGRLLRDHL
ncbi:MAG: aspartate/glutamate racemase family protein [Alphaproteobacteria bacterium]|nr:aspartate/glutamate racemase family protein [Alphaproteobacteria bacterium]